MAGALVDALKRLEYRGYDSAGVATLQGGELARQRGGQVAQSRGAARQGAARWYDRCRAYPLGHSWPPDGKQRAPSCHRPSRKVAAEYCPYDPNRGNTLMEWLQSVCAPPWVLRQADAILDRILPRHWSADELGKHLHVSDAERTMLRIYTIGSYDVPRAKRIKRREEKRRLAGTRSRHRSSRAGRGRFDAPPFAHGAGR